MSSSEKQCPICGEPNGCRVEQINACWCQTTHIPKAIQDYIPKDKVMKSCICKNCIELFIKDEKKFIEQYGRKKC